MDPNLDSDPDSGPAVFVSDLQDVNKKNYFNFLLIAFLGVHLHHFSKIKSHKSQNSRNQCFSYYVCLKIEGSGSLTNGSGFGSECESGSCYFRP
jgi:hypothetical protein